jgi:acetoin:2,6-dichlorophenolindophenol oxidoreductase subunit alpha
MAHRARAEGPSRGEVVRLSPEQWRHMYHVMVTIRIFEEHVNELYTSAKMPGLAHLYIGEEAVAAGVCQALRRTDYITSTHRGHGHCLAKGASVDRMFAELLGKEPGYCHGKGGSMHIADPETGNLGANAIVGGSTGIATGAALSAKMRDSGQVAVCFFGDGALNQGLLYESINMAALWKLPVIYVCEHNMYGEFTASSEVTAGNPRERPAAWGVPTDEVDGQDVRAVYAAALRRVEGARRGDGPAFLLCHTYRFRGHHVGDINRSSYRSAKEEQNWGRERDPLKILSRWLIEQRIADAAALEEIEREVRTEIEAGLKFALDAPYPDPGEVSTHVYA